MPKHSKSTFERLSDISDELYDIVTELEEKTKAAPMYFARRDRVVNVEKLDTSVEPPVFVTTALSDTHSDASWLLPPIDNAAVMSTKNA